MGKIVKFPSGGGEEEREEGARRLSKEEFIALLEPFRDGLKRLYPTQVEDILGMVGFGERNGKECFVMGVLIWQHQRQQDPVASTFLAVFVNNKLEKVSFLEAKNNYWDWKLMLDTYQTRFHTKEMFEELQKLRQEVLSGNIPT